MTKRQRTAALQDLAEFQQTSDMRASVVECGSPLPLSSQLDVPAFSNRPCGILFQRFFNFGRILAAIQYAPNFNHFFVDSIIDRKRKSFRNRAVVSANLSMNAGVKKQRIYIRKQGINKVAAQTFALALVEFPALREVVHRRGQHSNSHSKRFRNSFFAVSQSTNCSVPDLTRSSVARSSSKCHGGDSSASSSRLRSSHSASNAMSFSSRDICLMGNVITSHNLPSTSQSSNHLPPS